MSDLLDSHLASNAPSLSPRRTATCKAGTLGSKGDIALRLIDMLLTASMTCEKEMQRSHDRASIAGNIYVHPIDRMCLLLIQMSATDAYRSTAEAGESITYK